MADSGFTERYSEAPVALAAPPVPIHPATPSPVAPAPVVVNEPVRLYVNDSMNSRASFPLAAGSLLIEQRAALEPTFGPMYVLQAGNRVLLQGIAAQIYTDDLRPVRKITGSHGLASLYPAKSVAYAADPQTGVLAAFDLATGRKSYAVALMEGYGHRREWFTRTGNLIFVASLEDMVDPHGPVPEMSSLQLLQLKDPEAVSEFGIIESEEVANLIRKAQQLLAASLRAAIVTAFDDHVFLLDWQLKLRVDLHGAFTPERLSLDETGAIYLAVVEKGTERRSALWGLRADGGRFLRLLLDLPVSALIAPPIVGYDHTVYLLSQGSVMAVRATGEVLWTRTAQSGFAGATVTPDRMLVVSDGPELVTFDAAGQRRTVFRAAEPLVTPPALIEGGKALVASPKYLYLLSAKR